MEPNGTLNGTPLQLGSCGDKDEKKAIISSDRDRARSRWITVEPILLLIALARKAMVITRLQYLKHRIGEEHHYSSIIANLSVASLCNDDNYTDTLEDEIQQQTAVWSLYLYAMSTFPALFTTIVVGAISNLAGRKVAMMVPCLGYIIQCALFLVISYAHLPLWTFFAAELIQGISGGVALLFAGAHAYIADTTEKRQRTLRIAVTEGVYFFGNGAIQISNGYLISRFGYESSYWFSLVLLMLAFAYALSPHLLIETVDEETKMRTKQTTTVKTIVCTACDLFKVTEGRRNMKLIAAGMVLLFALVSVSGCQSVVVLYGLAKPFCWSPVDVGFYTAVSLILPGVGSLVGGQFVYYFNNDYWMMHISLISAMAMSLTTAMAKTTPVLYAGLVVGAMSSFIAPLVRGLMSKMVGEHEQVSVFTYAGCVGNTVKFIAKVMAFAIYAGTVHTLPTLTFYVLGFVVLIPIAITCGLQCMKNNNTDYDELGEDGCSDKLELVKTAHLK
ncbi:proton-coupled folate transporter-like [Lytechinus variegatus]|uniref:proton-coupled folate transporter-like n=1 Tax=Lytechinus variegatus TaxID=7654 RepID=UPI001BB2177C|nr:proton-coupled folate transporter-like [Lytechinus variegatus]